MISDKDWKQFKKIKDAALERFCDQVLADVSEGLVSIQSPSSYGRFLYVHRLVDNYNKQIALLFDGTSRSKAGMQLLLLRSEGLVQDEELAGISPAFLEQTEPGQ